MKHAASVLKLVADVIRVWKLPEPEPQAEAEAAPNAEAQPEPETAAPLTLIPVDPVQIPVDPVQTPLYKLGKGHAKAIASAAKWYHSQAAPDAVEDEGLGGTTRSGWLRQLDEDEIKKNGCQFCPPW